VDLEELLDLADRALASLQQGQVTVQWEGALAVVIVAVVGGRAGRAETSDPAAVERTARAAGLFARQARAWPAPALPGPFTGVARCGEGVREATVNTAGVRVAQEYARALPAPPRGSGGDEDVVAPQVVADALAAMRSSFGVGLALGGAPPAVAEAITLVDDSTVGLARAYDAEGVPRRRVTIFEAGVFRGGVHDSSSAEPSTGHATRALTLAPRAEHLVMTPGDADLGPPGGRTAVDLSAVDAVGSERQLVPLRGGGCALVPAVRVRR
jgi:predicted Zn-dependent protease